MRTHFNPKGFDAAERRLKEAGRDVMRAGSTEMQREAQRLAPVGEVEGGQLRRGIEHVPTKDGGYVISTAFYGVYVEYGTGRYAGESDSEYPGQRESTGSKAKRVPWVYWSPKLNQYVTTRGIRAQPHMRPGFDAGVEAFHQEKRKRGL